MARLDAWLDELDTVHGVPSAKARAMQRRGWRQPRSSTLAPPAPRARRRRARPRALGGPQADRRPRHWVPDGQPLTRRCSDGIAGPRHPRSPAGHRHASFRRRPRPRRRAVRARTSPPARCRRRQSVDPVGRSVAVHADDGELARAVRTRRTDPVPLRARGLGTAGGGAPSTRRCSTRPPAGCPSHASTRAPAGRAVRQLSRDPVGGDLPHVDPQPAGAPLGV